MRLVLVLLLAAAILAPLRNVHAQQSPHSYTPQTWAPQTWSPQTHSPHTHAPQGWTPQTGDKQTRSAPRRRVVKCRLSDQPDDYCSFYSDREFRPGSACSCDGSRGRTN